MDKINIAYKVVTTGHKSLGLRKNPTILHYPTGKWVSSPTIKPNKDDDGGIWAAKNKSGARRLQKYIADRYDIETFIFECQINRILYSNDYRIKTDKVKLLRRL